MFDDDYGYFGSGLDGYVHYNQAFERNFGSDGMDGGPSGGGRYIPVKPKASPAKSAEKKILTDKPEAKGRPKEKAGTRRRGAGARGRQLGVGKLLIWIAVLAAVIFIIEYFA